MACPVSVAQQARTRRAADGVCDVVVVGGGPAGSVTAALLAERGFEVLLLDRAHFPRPKACAEYVSPGAVALLDALGDPGLLQPGRGRRLRGMELRAPSGHRHLVDYCLPDGPRYALSVARAELDSALLDLARRRGARVREGVRVQGLLRGDHGAVCGVVGTSASAEVRVRARLVVGADGASSVVARRLGVQRARRWPRRLGLVAHLPGVPWPEEYGQMHIGRRGYVGVAPLDAHGTLSVGLVTPLRPGRLGDPRAALATALSRYPELAARLLPRGRLVPECVVNGIGPLAHTVSHAAGAGYLLVGDAAGFVDPFTGEGIYRAVRGAHLAAAAAERALEGDARGAATAYECARRAAFQAKERLTYLIQVFVHAPALMDYAVQRLAARPRLARALGNVLGDLEPAGAVVWPRFLWGLLRP